MMLGAVTDVMLYAALVAVTVFLLIYGLLQPWWRSAFGIAMILTLGALWQVETRAMLTVWLGEDYPGREWVLLAGRLEITVAMLIATIGLSRQLMKSWRATRRPESDRWSPRGHFDDCPPIEEPSEP